MYKKYLLSCFKSSIGKLRARDSHCKIFLNSFSLTQSLIKLINLVLASSIEESIFNIKELILCIFYFLELAILFANSNSSIVSISKDSSSLKKKG